MSLPLLLGVAHLLRLSNHNLILQTRFRSTREQRAVLRKQNARLQRFPFDILKIDRSFTNQLPDNEASSTLIRAIIAMAHALGLEVIAEGIEDRKQAGFLLVHHCEFGQGCLYSKPLTINDLHEHLAAERTMIA